MKIVIAPLAAQDLQEAYDFIAKDKKRAIPPRNPCNPRDISPVTPQDKLRM